MRAQREPPPLIGYWTRVHGSFAVHGRHCELEHRKGTGSRCHYLVLRSLTHARSGHMRTREAVKRCGVDTCERDVEASVELVARGRDLDAAALAPSLLGRSEPAGSRFGLGAVVSDKTRWR